MNPCQRCGRRSSALHDYPLASGTVAICAAMRERKAKIAANRLARRQQVEGWTDP